MDDMENNYSAEWYREQGKLMLYHNDGDNEVRSRGIDYLIKAYSMNDPEASYIVAVLLLQKALKSTSGDSEEQALSILRSLADNGDPRSRILLNSICLSKYRNSIPSGKGRQASGKLVDFEGKPIKISRKGLMTPIDAELEYKDGKNVLHLNANISFINCEELPDPELFKKAVVGGINEWNGEYTVFGGQAVTVEIGLTFEPRLFDNVAVVPVTSGFSDMISNISKKIGTKDNRERLNDILESKRSFATSGLKWSATSRKFIYILCDDNRFTDYYSIKDVAKHEFGHSLGLGDLYYSPSDNLSGVEKGTYRELDCFYISDKFYNLVMCDHHGPISNNDIEMIILAFRENKAQLYQKSDIKGKISTALGKGN